MSQKIAPIFFACGLFALTPVSAVDPSLQVETAGWSGQTVTVSVHNPNSFTVTGCVRICVQLADGTITTLTSAEFQTIGGTTLSLAVSASQAVAGIEDNPEPFGISALN